MAYYGDGQFRCSGKVIDKAYSGRTSSHNNPADAYFIMQINLIDNNVLFFGSGISPSDKTENGVFGFPIDDEILAKKPFRIALCTELWGFGVIHLEKILEAGKH